MKMMTPIAPSQISQKKRTSALGAVALLACCLLPQAARTQAPAQAPAKPAAAPTQPKPAQQKPAQPAASTAPQPSITDDRTFTNADIAQRPYNGVFTRPQYPSTRPVQKQFTVTYVYNYAQSDYTPPVPLPTVSKAAQSFSTPENAAIALISAMRRGSYEDWLSCWDSDSQAAYEAQSKAQPTFRAKMTERFKTLGAGHLVFLDRVDTVNYVVLDVADDDLKNPHHGQPSPIVLVFEQGRWRASSRFNADSLVAKLAFAIPGDTLTQTFDLRPESKGTSAVNRAQEAFLNKHTQNAKVTITTE